MYLYSDVDTEADIDTDSSTDTDADIDADMDENAIFDIEADLDTENEASSGGDSSGPGDSTDGSVPDDSAGFLTEGDLLGQNDTERSGGSWNAEADVDNLLADLNFPDPRDVGDDSPDDVI
jgi:hypothetical protein